MTIDEVGPVPVGERSWKEWAAERSTRAAKLRAWDFVAHGMAG